MSQILSDTTYYFSPRTTMWLEFLADGRMQCRVYYCLFSLSPSSSLGISNQPHQRYWTRLHSALSWCKTGISLETNRWDEYHNIPKKMLFLSNYTEIRGRETFSMKWKKKMKLLGHFDIINAKKGGIFSFLD